MATTAEIASRVATELATAGFDLLVEHDEQTLLVSGLVSTEAERAAAIDIATTFAGDDLNVDDSIEVTGAMPQEAGDLELSESEIAGFEGATAGLEDEESAVPGDFTDQPSIAAPQNAQPMSLSDDGEPLGEDASRPAEDGEAYVPPTDPVSNASGITGGFSRSSMDSTEPLRSSDGTIGDEAIRDAVLQELREDAATAGLDIEADVVLGVVTLTGEVADIVDAENAEEVAARVTGVNEVRERLVVVSPGGTQRPRP
ncbi:MAG: BON domain-containing protein [Dehalococcoidia bacterium]|nr:BON domain-containing protein [Dehalococcoidia bacterium]